MITITPEIAPFPRELLRGTGNSTVMDWLFEVDGAPTAATTAQAWLKSGSTTIRSYTTGAGNLSISSTGGVQATVDGSDLSAYELFEPLWMALSATVNGRVERFGEQVLVTDQIVRCPCRLQEVLDLHRAFAEPQNYVQGHTSDDASPGWAFLFERVWADTRAAIWSQYPQTDWARLRTPPTLRQYVREATAVEIADRLAGDRGQSSDLLDFRDTHMEIRDRWFEQARILQRDDSGTEHPDEPALVNTDLKRPPWLGDFDREGYI